MLIGAVRAAEAVKTVNNKSVHAFQSPRCRVVSSLRLCLLALHSSRSGWQAFGPQLYNFMIALTKLSNLRRSYFMHNSNSAMADLRPYYPASLLPLNCSFPEPVRHIALDLRYLA